MDLKRKIKNLSKTLLRKVIHPISRALTYGVIIGTLPVGRQASPLFYLVG